MRPVGLRLLLVGHELVWFLHADISILNQLGNQLVETLQPREVTGLTVLDVPVDFLRLVSGKSPKDGSFELDRSSWPEAPDLSDGSDLTSAAVSVAIAPSFSMGCTSFQAGITAMSSP